PKNGDLSEFDVAHSNTTCALTRSYQLCECKLEARSLVEEPWNYLGSTTKLFKCPLDDVRRADCLSVRLRTFEVHQACVQVIEKTTDRGRVDAFILRDEFLGEALSHLHCRCVVNRTQERQDLRLLVHR